MSTLYVVATPIGNLEDLTRRSERVLAEVAHVAAEDTRRTGLLLKHLGVRTEMVSLHAHNEASRVPQILGWLDAGADVALVTDAGTPLVSDPGERLVSSATERGHVVVPVPGPSAVLAALVGSGLPAGRFVFLGFVPRKGRDRSSTLTRIAGSEETCVLFESPERLRGFLSDLVSHCGPDRRAVVARELTKLHEEFRRGTVAELLSYYSEHKARGEVTVVVECGKAETGTWDQEALEARARELLESGMPPSGVARELVAAGGVSRNRAYGIVQELKGDID